MLCWGDLANRTHGRTVCCVIIIRTEWRMKQKKASLSNQCLSALIQLVAPEAVRLIVVLSLLLPSHLLVCSDTSPLSISHLTSLTHPQGLRMTRTVPQWRWQWRLGRRVWWCPARMDGLWGTSSSKPPSDTGNFWSRYASQRFTPFSFLFFSLFCFSLCKKKTQSLCLLH